MGILRKRLVAALGRPLAGRQSGMSLIEIIIVVALIGTLMAYMIRNVMGTADKAKEDQTKLAQGQIYQSLMGYRTDNNKYPTTDQGLQALLTDPGSAKNWRGPYIEDNKLKDPWGEEFTYESDGKKFKIVSSGIDQEAGTADDISYPEEEKSEKADGG